MSPASLPITLRTSAFTEISIDADSLEGSGLLVLRIGQRVKFDTEERDGARIARRLRLVTFD